MTSGDSGSQKYAKEQLAEIREREAREAAQVLGVGENRLAFLKQPDGFLNLTSEVLTGVAQEIREKRPTHIYIPHMNDNHPDHKATYEIVDRARWMASGPWFQECKGEVWDPETVLAYEVWTPMVEIQYSADITEFMDKKIEALKKHSSQIDDIPYHEGVEGLNRYRGVMTGKGKYVECFQVLKINKI